MSDFASATSAGAVPGETMMASANRAINASCAHAKQMTDDTAAFIRGQPFAAALIALTIGYILGRLRV